jgi:hypothetical protein
VMHLAPTIGGLLFSATLAGNLYEAAGEAHGDPRGACFGSDCYRCCCRLLAASVRGGLHIIGNSLPLSHALACGPGGQHAVKACIF